MHCSMKVVNLILNVVALVWVICVYTGLLFFSVFWFDSPDATQLQVWFTFITSSLIVCGIPLCWFGFRIYQDSWLRDRNNLIIFGVIVAAWCLLPFFIWNGGLWLPF